MEDIQLPRELLWEVITFLPNLNQENIKQCIKQLQRRFAILENVIRYALRKQLPLASRLIDDKYDNLLMGSFHLLRY